KNIDLCLFRQVPTVLAKDKYRTPTYAIAFGELKGGIDPAGADEHWKTAGTALSRIRTAYSEYDCSPHTFFVGAAVESKMAQEMWAQLEDGTLTNAAMLNDDDQVASLSSWLCQL